MHQNQNIVVNIHLSCPVKKKGILLY